MSSCGFSVHKINIAQLSVSIYIEFMRFAKFRNCIHYKKKIEFYKQILPLTCWQRSVYIPVPIHGKPFKKITPGFVTIVYLYILQHYEKHSSIKYDYNAKIGTSQHNANNGNWKLEKWANVTAFLTHCGLVTKYGDKDLGQHWPRQWRVAWRRQVITWSNVDVSSVRSSYIHPMAISQEIHQPSMTKICTEFTHQNVIKISLGPTG